MNIHNFISSLKNAQTSNLEKFTVRKSSVVMKILQILILNGYVSSYKENKNTLLIYLKYPIVQKIDLELVSKQSRKIYANYEKINKSFFKNDLVLVSTKDGVTTNKELLFFRTKLGGEILLKVKN